MRKVVLAVVMVGVYSHADAEVLCKKANGAVFVRTACKPKDVQIDPVALGLQGPKGDKGDKGDTGLQGPAGPPASTLSAYDTNGNRVGDVISASSAPATVIVIFEIAGHLLALSVDKNEIHGHISGLPHFESTDCSGTPFVEQPLSHSIFPLVMVGAPGKTIYLPDPEATPQQFQYRSLLDSTLGCVEGNDVFTGVPATPLIDLDTLFTPPFMLRCKNRELHTPPSLSSVERLAL